MKTNKTIDEILKEAVENAELDDNRNILFDFYLFGVGFYIYNKFESYVEFLETFPYREDGDIPMIFLKLGFIEVTFENKKIYKYLYKRKYNEELDI
jgi:hypothetical protein